MTSVRPSGQTTTYEDSGPGTILIVEDDTTLAQTIDAILSGEGYEVIVSEDGWKGLRAARDGAVDVVITDYRLPGMGGMELLERLIEANNRLPVIMMTSYGTADTAISATKRGAFDFLLKPFEMDDLIGVVRKAMRSSKFMSKRISMGGRRPPSRQEATMIGSSAAMREVFKEIGHVAPTDATVLIRGETGSGKELVARAIYQHSNRDGEAFVAVNCGAIPETLLESELFGHRRGAFTGADVNRVGRLEQADKGTLFLDEVGDMPLTTQIKLLRALQEKCIQPLGSSEEIEIDVRLMAATHQNLEQRIAEGKFREDLYYRLNTVMIQVPPLRERPEDIPDLVRFLIRKAATEIKTDPIKIDRTIMKRFQEHDWPGNVRQLDNVVTRVVLLGRGRGVNAEDVEAILSASGASFSDMEPESSGIHTWVREALHEAMREGRGDVHPHLVAELERILIVEAVRLTRGHQGKMCDLLGISRVTLRQRLRQMSMNAKD